ncbi:hypothetical protein EDD22DRAFT_951222 [Suillus occidentalis]|nr:hypothetical protein EDD22DRAFT_951222 [Suillus occidentalis]
MNFSNAFYNGSGCWNWWSSVRCTRQRDSQSSNHGSRITPGSAPPWRNGFLPRNTWREPAWADRSWVIRPTLPARQPDHSVWFFPMGDLTWTPHTNGLGFLPETAQIPAMPRPQTVYERPQIAPWIVKNPFQPTMPMLQWDVRQNPITARLTTGAHVSTNLAHVLSSPITNIPVGIIEIAIPACPMAYMWNAIRVQKTSAIKVQDVLDAIYEWLQIPLTRAEMEHIEDVNPYGVDAVLQALQERASTSPTLHGWEHRQGPRRIDCLGDVRRWMGLNYSPTGQGMQLILNLQVIQRL